MAMRWACLLEGEFMESEEIRELEEIKTLHDAVEAANEAAAEAREEMEGEQTEEQIQTVDALTAQLDKIMKAEGPVAETMQEHIKQIFGEPPNEGEEYSQQKATFENAKQNQNIQNALDDAISEAKRQEAEKVQAAKKEIQELQDRANTDLENQLEQQEQADESNAKDAGSKEEAARDQAVQDEVREERKGDQNEEEEPQQEGEDCEGLSCMEEVEQEMEEEFKEEEGGEDKKEEKEEEKKKKKKKRDTSWAKALLLLMLMFGAAFIGGNVPGPGSQLAPGCSYYLPGFIRAGKPLDLAAYGRVLIPMGTVGGIPAPWNTNHNGCTGYTCTFCAFATPQGGVVYPSSPPSKLTCPWQQLDGCRTMQDARDCGKWTPTPEAPSLCQWDGQSCAPRQPGCQPCALTPSSCKPCLTCGKMPSAASCNTNPSSARPVCTWTGTTCRPTQACQSCPTTVADFIQPNSPCRTCNRSIALPTEGVGLAQQRELQYACLNHDSKYTPEGIPRCSTTFLQQQCNQHHTAETCQQGLMQYQCKWTPASTPLPSCAPTKARGTPCAFGCRASPDDTSCSPITGQCNWNTANSHPQWMKPDYAFYGNMVPWATSSPTATAATVDPYVAEVRHAQGCHSLGGQWQPPETPDAGFGWACVSKAPDGTTTVLKTVMDYDDCMAAGGEMNDGIYWWPVYYNPCSNCVNLQTLMLPQVPSSRSSAWWQTIVQVLQSFYLVFIAVAVAAVLVCLTLFRSKSRRLYSKA